MSKPKRPPALPTDLASLAAAVVALRETVGQLVARDAEKDVELARLRERVRRLSEGVTAMAPSEGRDVA